MIKAEKVFDEVFSARNFYTSPLTISGLDGDVYDYELVATCDGGAFLLGKLQFNGDSAANYRDYHMRGWSTSTAAGTSDSATGCELISSYGTRGLSKVRITGSSGEERYVDTFQLGDYSTNVKAIYKRSGYWKNTVDNITSLTFVSVYTGIKHSHIMLYRTPKAAGQSEWELMKTDEINQSAMNTTGYEVASGLDLDTDGEYKVTIENGNLTAGVFWIRLNDINLTNEYTTQRIRNNGGGLTSSSTVNYPSIYPTGENDFGGASFTISGSTGNKRLITGSVPSNHGVAEQCEFTAWWNNTVDNLTSIQLYSNSSSTMTGTMKLYRKRNPAGTGDTLPFEVIKTHEFSGDFSAGFDFTGLLGDSVTMYKLEIDGVGASSDIDLRLSINNDIGTNYVEQYLVAINSSVSAANVTPFPYFRAEAVRDSARYNIVFYIYPKSGSNRPILMKQSNSESMIWLKGLWWLNSVSEITSLKLLGSNTNPITGKLTLSRLV